MLLRLRVFLGWMVIITGLLKIFSKLAFPLTQLTRKGQAFVWNASCEDNFQELKKKLTLAPFLILPSPTEYFVMYCDSSLMGLGGMLMQNRQVIAYTSRQLIVHERNYSTHDL